MLSADTVLSVTGGGTVVVVNVLAVLVGHASDSHRDQLLPTVLSPTYASIVVAATGVLIVSHAIDSRLTQLSLAAVATVPFSS